MQAAQFVVPAVEDVFCDWRDAGELLVLGWFRGGGWPPVADRPTGGKMGVSHHGMSR